LARALHGDDVAAPHVEWLAIAAEDYAFERCYSAVVAAEAFHWLDWYTVMPRIAKSLVPGGHLILVDRTLAEPLLIRSPIELDTDGAILLRQDGRASWARFHGSRMADASSPWSSSAASCSSS